MSGRRPWGSCPPAAKFSHALPSADVFHRAGGNERMAPSHARKLLPLLTEPAHSSPPLPVAIALTADPAPAPSPPLLSALRASESPDL
jgi:hypothetical protein